MNEFLKYNVYSKNERSKGNDTYPELLIKEAIKWLGYKSLQYRESSRGRTLQDGFDCSGFVTFLLERIQFPLSSDIRHCNEYFDKFGIFVHLGLQRKGDLVFFSKNGVSPSHMGIMVSKDEYIHAPGIDSEVISIESLEVRTIQTVKDKYKDKQIYTINPIGFKRLAIPNGRWKQIC